MPPRTRYDLAFLIFILSLSLYLSLISKGPVTVDCLDLTVKVQQTLNTCHLNYLYGFGYPLMVLLGLIFTVIGKYIGITDNVLVLNFIGVIFGSISVVLLFLLVSKLSDMLTSLIASFILLLNPIFMDVSTYGISHAPTLCFLLLGLLSLVRFHNNPNTTRLLLSALCFGLMGATRFQDFILTSPFIGTVLIFGLTEDSKKNKLCNIFLFIGILALIIILFHLPYFFGDRNNYSIQLKNFWKSGLTENFKGIFSPSLMASFSYLTAAFTQLGIFCFLAGLLYMVCLNQKLFLLTILWWIIPLSFYGNLVTTAPRFLTIMLPAFIIPISFFLTYLFRHKNRMLKLLALICFLTILFEPLQKTLETFVRRHHYALISDFYHWVGQVTETDALIISSDDGPFIAYYANRKFLSKPSGARHLLSKELTDFKKNLDQILNNRTPLYITKMGLSAYDYYGEFENFMRQNYRLTTIGQKPLELWYTTPFDPKLHMSELIKIER